MMLKTYIKYLFILLLTLTAGACGNNKIRDSRDRSSINKSKEIDAINASMEAATKEEAFLLIRPKGTKLGYLNPKALNTQYKRVFKASGRVYAHCSRGEKTMSHECAQIFSQEELKELGNFGIYQVSQFGINNVDQIDSMNLNYTRALRSMLGRECSVVTRREIKDPSAKGNILIKSLGPVDEKTLHTFLEKILAVEGMRLAIDSRSKAYAEAANKIIGTSLNKDLIEKTHRNLCIAIGMNPLVIFY